MHVKCYTKLKLFQGFGATISGSRLESNGVVVMAFTRTPDLPSREMEPGVNRLPHRSTHMLPEAPTGTRFQYRARKATLRM